MDEQWIFGYGSLIWRPDFSYVRKVTASIRGWQRRFWQASPDHRGTIAEPGRVVTLVEAAEEICWGVAYKITTEHCDEILEALDYRERAGYRRMYAPLSLRDTGTIANALVYVADPDDPNYIGDDTTLCISDIIGKAHGQSGSNRDYVLQLHAALQDIGCKDNHVSDLVHALHKKRG